MKNGFSLLELIAVLLLAGVLVLSAAISLLPITEGLVQVRDNVSSAQKAQFAMIRLVREFSTITNVVDSGTHSITYDFLDPSGTGIRHTLDWSGQAGDPLRLENTPLFDDVGSFQLRYFEGPGFAPESSWSSASRTIELVLENMQGTHRYTNRITPRNITIEQ